MMHRCAAICSVRGSSLKAASIALLLAAACAAPARTALAQTWSEVARSAEGVTYVAPGSFQRTADSLRFWALTDHAAPRKQVSTGRTYRSTRMQREVRCNARTMAISRSELFEQPGATGMPVGEFVVPNSAFHFSPVAPGNDDDAVLEFVCARAAAN
jgi:hypothetical protein